MGDWQAEGGFQPNGKPHVMIRVMNALGYDLGTLGNHDFNYGLEFQKNVLADAHFPVISSNVLNAATNKPLVRPWLIKKLSVKDSSGVRRTLKVGFLSFAPPQILEWDRRHLHGKVKVLDMLARTRELVPQLRKQGADLVVILAHSGFGEESYQSLQENTVYHLSQVPGVDAIAFGHSHSIFPSSDYADRPNVDTSKGTIHGVPAVMAGHWGSHLGVIDLDLEYRQKGWHVAGGHSEARPIATDDGKALVEADARLTKLLADDRAQTRAFFNSPVGTSKTPLYSFLALVQDDPGIEIVNRAQIDYVKRFAENRPEFKGLPVLGASAPFKAGGRGDEPDGYTMVDSGALTRRSISDLYLYPNTLVVVKLTGAELREWLERSAGLFNQIDPHSRETQQLVNWAGFRTYNFDVIDGVTYQIDISQPSRYDGAGKLVNSAAHRIGQLRWQGKPVKADQTFLLATNNYRAWGGGNFPGTGKDHVVYAAPDETRQIVSDYVTAISKEQGSIDPRPDNNWKLAPLSAVSGFDLRFRTAPSDKAQRFVSANAIHPVQRTSTDKQGFALYRIDLDKS